MPTWSTPEPISASLDVTLGDVRVTAGERTDTVVEVRPSDPGQDHDVRAAQQTRIDLTGGRLVVTTPRPRGLGLFGRQGSVDLDVELPAGSDLQIDAQVVVVRCAGRLRHCRVTTGTGDLQVDAASRLELTTGAGAILVEEAATADVSTGSGTVRIGFVHGATVVKNSNGTTWLGEVGGETRVRSANGDITVDHARAGVTATTANGDLLVGTVDSGSVSLKTSYGRVEVGLPVGTAARLDLHTSWGSLRNLLDAVGGPEQSDRTVDLHARTSYGDIVVRRA